MKVVAKEADETYYWLLLCKHAESYPDSSELIKELSSIIKVTSKIIASTKQKQKHS